MKNHIWTLPILAGPLRGFRWAPASGGKLGRHFFGTYEQEQTQLLRRSFSAESVFFDVGANHGYYSLLASRLSRGAARVLAFEPSPDCLKFLRQHIHANRLGQVEIIDAAVGAKRGTAWFEDGSGSGTGHLATQGTRQVNVVSIDDIVAERKLAPTHIKIDVEGAEVQVLAGAAKTLRDHRPEIFLSTHGADIHAECCRVLRDIGYELAPIRGTDLAETPEIHCLPTTAAATTTAACAA